MAWDGDTPVALVLEYNGPTPQPLFAMGREDGIAVILRDLIRPRVAYVAAPPAVLPGDRDRLPRRPGSDDGPDVGGPGAFPAVPGQRPAAAAGRDRRPQPAVPARLRVVAAVDGDRRRRATTACASTASWSSAAGTHVVSPGARLAVVGNVLTHVDYRGRGFATAVTGAVTAELLRTCDQVVLNVRSDNPPALNAYRRLGYAEHVRFEERLVHRLGSPWPDLAAPLRRLFNRKETDPR